MMSLWDALRMNMMISYQELVRTFPYTATFLASFCSPLWIFRKIAGTASTSRHNASGLS